MMYMAVTNIVTIKQITTLMDRMWGQVLGNCGSQPSVYTFYSTYLHDICSVCTCNLKLHTSGFFITLTVLRN